MKEKVLFLLDNEGCGDPLYAAFPYIVGTIDPHLMGLYAHIGQHGTVHMDYVAKSRPATPEQYQGLKAELENIGYDLEVLEGHDPQAAFEAREHEIESFV